MPPQKPFGETAPLILFLHGAGERGNENERQLIHLKKPIFDLSQHLDHGFYVLAPQCPKEERWVEVDWSQKNFEMQPEISASLHATMKLLERLISELPIDPDRIYICGLSMGGFGTWDLICRFPHRFAAALPICGGGDPGQATKIAHLPIWTFHGELDRTVPPDLTRNMVKALQQENANVRYSELKNTYHNSWAPAFSDHQVWSWMFGQSR